MATLAEDYLDGRSGSPFVFRYNLDVNKQRLGQAFFNALSETDQARLQGTLQDPFYQTSSEAVHKAIEYLLDTE